MQIPAGVQLASPSSPSVSSVTVRLSPSGSLSLVSTLTSPGVSSGVVRLSSTALGFWVGACWPKARPRGEGLGRSCRHHRVPLLAHGHVERGAHDAIVVGVVVDDAVVGRRNSALHSMVGG